jgi:hypothetical protein
MEIYTKYKAKRVLNFCAGWGGSTVAAAALNLEAFYGVDINTDLEEPYDIDRYQWLVEICHTEYTIPEIQQGLWLKRIRSAL